jgi:hypothetical protein
MLAPLPPEHTHGQLYRALFFFVSVEDNGHSIDGNRRTHLGSAMHQRRQPSDQTSTTDVPYGNTPSVT